VPRLFDALALARSDGRYPRLLKTLARVQLLILDDWGLSALTETQQRDLLEIVANAPRLLSPVRFRSSNGARSSAIRRSQTPFSIASFTTLIGFR
jgi:DNA replication protein DnaC